MIGEKLPPPFIPRKIEDFIYYYYAKLVIAPSAGFQLNYRFIISTYKKLKAKEILLSDYDREIDLMLKDYASKCIFCDKYSINLEPTNVVSRKWDIPFGMQNIVMVCNNCKESKGNKNLIKWWCEDLGKERDQIPRVAIGIYLKIAYEYHKTNFSLDKKCSNLIELFE
ncbi:MAG: hypothetical protein PHQ76_05285 [Caldisericia bacterium]|nr:hypothetical protein [Caldisericia bacterium]MDD5689667.1 hypothetical protein [Caldisericia bacterium]